jgi:hypothetical protein
MLLERDRSGHATANSRVKVRKPCILLMARRLRSRRALCLSMQPYRSGRPRLWARWGDAYIIRAVAHVVMSTCTVGIEQVIVPRVGCTFATPLRQ